MSLAGTRHAQPFPAQTGPATGCGGASPLAATVPGVFAIGHVRAGSTRRVAAAGEGAQAVAAVHASFGAAG